MQKPPAGKILVLGILGTVACITALLIPIDSGATSGPAATAFRDALHFPFFVILTVCLFLLFKATPPFNKSRIAPVVAGFAFAVAIAFGSEWFQGHTGRSASWIDLINDLLGAGVATVFLLATQFRKGGNSTGLRIALGLSIAVTAFCLLPVLTAWGAEAEQKRQFPDLGGFRSGYSLYFWMAQGISAEGLETKLKRAIDETSSETVLQVICAPAAWSGTSKALPAGTRDWSAYPKISLTVTNPGQPFEIGIRIDGAASSISTGISVPRGTSTIALAWDSDTWEPGPPNAEWLADVRKFVLHTGDSEVAHPFILNEVRLVPDTAPSPPAAPPQEASADR